jgi:hypothetical protein
MCSNGGGSLYACHQRRRRWWSGLQVNLETIVELVVLGIRGEEAGEMGYRSTRKLLLGWLGRALGAFHLP